MIGSILDRSKKSKPITEKDIPELKHWFIMLYGWDCWNTIGLDEMLEMLPQLNKEIRWREEFKQGVLKGLGIKNK
jgi:hypothetical protein